MPRWRNG